ncbi:2-hydroxyacid dehydrogenase [Actinophytocola glycyrrhizae]|uniref:2-hydroxyacid dehydrogenase n=1 Tax=Actinophytocola glycyrrhizae TaxID=2044873 RepID=A0ABV9S4H1_9PSEU
MTITVLVPDEAGVTALTGVNGLDVVRYDTAAALPGNAEVLVPGFLTRAEPEAFVAALPNLRLVQLLTAGAEGWIGRVPEHVMLSVARGAHGGSTAEWALATLLAVYRDLIPFERERTAHRWGRRPTETLIDKKVLVIGAGDLGTQLKRRLEACDATTTLVGTRAREGVHGFDEVPELLAAHDAVVLMVPLTPATEGMVDAAFLSMMRDGAVLVNAARGRVVDTGALVAELARGRLRAALDVTEPEPPPADHPLWTLPNVLLTPHVAASVEGYERRAYEVVAQEIARYAAGERPHNLVRGDY